MRDRARATDFRKYVRHVLTAAGALLLIAAAGLDGPGPESRAGGGGPAPAIHALND